MHRYRVILSVSLGAIACVAIATALSTNHEATWDGESLSYWLQIGYGTGMTHGETDRDDADVAVRHVGTNALPYLIRELGATYSPTRWRLVQLAQRQSFISVSYRYPDERRSRAIGAFQALGRIAAPALPQLRCYLADPELRGDAQRVIDAILEIDRRE
jgi:hypothetical protein